MKIRTKKNRMNENKWEIEWIGWVFDLREMEKK